MGENLTHDFTPQCHHLRWLTEHLDGWQFGEQGLIDTLLRTLKLTHGLCIEFGAGDGDDLPVTIDHACQFHQSQCILVEIDDEKRKSLSKIYPDATVCKTLDWNNKYLDEVNVVVIDIDGQDSVVMREMFEAGVRPTLVVVEHMDRHFPIGTSIPDTIPQWMLGLKLKSGHAIQDTAETLHAIAAQNGYERIGFNRCNSFFVVKERYTDLFR
jgi:hypothetical protein